MGHPSIRNNTPFAFEPLFLFDEDGRALMSAISKATYIFDEKNRLSLSKAQASVNWEGEYRGDPDCSSYRYEPETAFFKPATDVVLIGSACAHRSRTTEIDVGFQVGNIKKAIRVIGDRIWEKSMGIVTMTDPEPFEKMPLAFERSFGGWDRSHADPKKHTFEPKNPVGTGFRDHQGRFEEGIHLPNLENPIQRIKSYGDRPPPTGFGFHSPHWESRSAFAGTYDEKWGSERMPLLPTDFDRRFFNAAPPDQIVPGFLKGDEQVVVTNASLNGRIAFHLPHVNPPICKIELRGNHKHELRTNLDTVIVNADDNLLFLIWRVYVMLKSGPHDVVSIEVFSKSISKNGEPK